MNAHLQWLAADIAVLRVFAPGQTYGSRYTWCCTLVRTGECVECLGVMRAPTADEREAIRRALWAVGVYKMSFERYRPDGTVEKHQVR